MSTLSPSAAESAFYTRLDAHHIRLAAGAAYQNLLTPVALVCAHGHEFAARPSSILQGKLCPVDARPTVAFSTPADHPELATQFDRERNPGRTPDQIIAATSEKLWWTCAVGHHWQASGDARARGTGCPACH